MNAGLMPTLAALRARGAWQELEGVEPPTTAVSHASLATGNLPAHTGIVGERVHRPEDGLYWYTSAYDLPIQAEPLWVSARQAGLTCAVLFWPGATSWQPDLLADYTLGYGEREAYSKLHRLTFYPAQGWAGEPITFSPPQESWFDIEGIDDRFLITVYVLALDTSDDAVVNYDSFILSSGDRSVDEHDATLHASGEWVGWRIEPASELGTDFLIVDPRLGSFALYQGNVYRLLAAPEEFQRAVVGRFGPSVPPPDYYALEHGWIDQQQYMAMVQRQSDWMMAITVWVYGTYHPDMLLTVQSPLDQVGHQFLMVDASQPAYTPERAATFAAYRSRAAAQLDHALSDLMSVMRHELDSGEVVLFVIGTTGMAPIHTRVNVNTLLAQAGLLRLGNRGFVIVEHSQAIAFASGGAVHVYINMAGRESAGIVPQDAYRAVQDQIAGLLRDLVDPTTGERVFARVMLRSELGSIGLDGALAGDVFAQANPGYTLSDERGLDSVFEPASFYGQQGYPAGMDEMKGVLIAAGRGIRPGSGTGDALLIDVVPTVAALLGFTLTSADGRILDDLLAP